jgi:hypothetical protein
MVRAARSGAVDVRAEGRFMLWVFLFVIRAVVA